MAKWKLCRQTFGTETYPIAEGSEVTLGRGLNNTITLSSLVISRAHCVIYVQSNQLIIKDLNSSNGVYVGTKRIPTNSPYEIKDSDIIGIGWTADVPLANIKDSEKFLFKVIREQPSPPPPAPIINRITFQSDDELDLIEKKIANLDKKGQDNDLNIHESKPFLKRKISFEANSKNIVSNKTIKKEVEELYNDENVINILSDGDTDVNIKTVETKKPKLESVLEDPQKLNNRNNKNEMNLKTENEYLEFEAFNVKQEYIDDEVIPVDSDSDSESEHWYLRLSQSSPGKPFTILRDKSMESKPEDSSYSQMDDDLGCNAFMGDENDYLDDPITMPIQPPSKVDDLSEVEISVEKTKKVVVNSKSNIDNYPVMRNKEQITCPTLQVGIDEVDGFNSKNEISPPSITVAEIETPSVKKTQMIEPLNQMPRKKTNQTTPEINQIPTKKSSKNIPERKTKGISSKHDKKSKHSSKNHNVTITNSQKEERKRKLKEIANKEKGELDKTSKEELNKSSSSIATELNELPLTNNINQSNKVAANVKITSSNRQAFLTESVKPVKRKEKESPPKTSTTKSKKSSSPKEKPKLESPKQLDNNQNTRKEKKDSKSKHDSSKTKDSKSDNSSVTESRDPVQSLKSLTASANTKIDPIPQKKKKQVHFSEEQPEIHYFEIQAGNRMKKTSLVKTSLVDARQMPVFSLEKITLMKILRWNPHWLEEQVNNNEPPPILGHSNPPLAIFHSFTSHNQYVQLIGDLLLMEIWECLSIAYSKIRSQNTVGLRMVIASLPPVPTQERHFDIFNISVHVSLPTSEIRSMPRVGEILLVSFGPENARHQRFFFVHNVRCLPSPQNNRTVLYNLSLHATFSDKMRLLRPGEVMLGINLAYINKELSLFEAMAYMGGSPLSEAILRPEPRHFVRNPNPPINITNQWTTTLNPSQLVAVASSVSAALGDQPCIQMVQGPPGTGKSSVICSIVMSYFYDSSGKRQQNRGKILICATSNAAVDELVIRLLLIRQKLPPAERFRMVRVGRVEAMHPRARDVSSQNLAQRDAARLHQEPQNRPGLNEEIAHIEAKINMWKTAAQDAAAKAEDPMRVAYCQGRITDLVKRIALLRIGSAGGGDEIRPEQVQAAERRIIEGADIVVTTLASAHNHKMKGLKRRIALCIVDEAGQAIEPETLIPLTLDVTKLTLIGDPQQLPGYICSQRAKKHGLGESLFSRLAGCSGSWREGSVAVLLNEQYRMHEHIALYPNRAFYAGAVRSVPPRRPDLPLPPYALVAISSGDKGQNAAGANEIEAWGVSRLVVALSAMLRPHNLSLAVITPYNAHKELIKKNLKMLMDSAEPQVEVNTVDSFQGQERDVTVVSLARSQGVGFLTDAGRMNVMLTRARHALLVCLNPHAVLKHHQWRTLVEDAQKRKLYRTLPYKTCQATSQITNDEIIRHVM